MYTQYMCEKKTYYALLEYYIILLT